MKINALSKRCKMVLFIMGLAAFLYGASAFAGMRCGNELILEGGSVVNISRLCGQPDQAGQNIMYLNKDKDGMNYYIHSDANGIIDDIKYSRGGLR
jgi:hypothetical protein